MRAIPFGQFSSLSGASARHFRHRVDDLWRGRIWRLGRFLICIVRLSSSINLRASAPHASPSSAKRGQAYFGKRGFRERNERPTEAGSDGDASSASALVAPTVAPRRRLADRILAEFLEPWWWYLCRSSLAYV